MSQCAVVWVGLGLWLAACSGSSKTTPQTEMEPERICEPGAKSCDGQNVKVCSDDGTERLIVETCPASQSCADGECTETSCVANTKFCQDGSVWKCDRTGGGASLYDTCSASEFCRVTDDTATCVTQSCTPGEPLCDGDTATLCAPDGSGPMPDGADCAADAQTCYKGQCQDTECMPGSKLCQNGDVYLCADNGTDTSLLVDCASGNVCDGTKSACVRQVCEVGAVSCEGSRITKCNAYGSAWEPSDTDCAKDNRACVDGTCQKQVCTPSGSFCQDGSVFQCDSSGTKATLWQTCTPYYHCAPYPSSNYATCEYNQCQPNQLTCDGNYVRTCNADGTWPEAGTYCGDDKYCESGACKARVCEPGTVFCKDNDLYSCDWLGAYSSLWETCPTDTLCKVTDSDYRCVPLPCSPGETTCLNNKIGTCAADGQTLSTVKEDCSTSASICGPDYKCSKSVVDTLGVAEDSITESSNMLIGNAVEVTSARKLTEMQLDMGLAAPRELRWVVFEQTNVETYTAKQDWIVKNQTGNGFFSSGPINFALKAGKTYIFGVVITGGNTSTAVLDTAPFATNLSFGKALGRIESGYSPQLYTWHDAGFLYHMKVTTAP